MDAWDAWVAWVALGEGRQQGCEILGRSFRPSLSLPFSLSPFFLDRLALLLWLWLWLCDVLGVVWGMRKIPLKSHQLKPVKFEHYDVTKSSPAASPATGGAAVVPKAKGDRTPNWTRATPAAGHCRGRGVSSCCSQNC